jgi:hypothetical protein
LVKASRASLAISSSLSRSFAPSTIISVMTLR